MTRSRALAAVFLLTTPACSDDGSKTDEVGDTGESTTQDVSTFEDSSSTDFESSESESDSSTESSDSSTDSSSDSDSGTDTSSDSSTDASTDTSSDSSTDSGTDSSTGDDEAPFVIATTPDDATIGVASGTSIAITFSELMDGATLTTNTADTTCSGTVQVSADDFVTCVPMSAQPSTGDDLTYAISPAAPLASAAAYQLRVLADASDLGGNPMLADFTSEFTVRYFHTIVLDGSNDFTADETFASATLGHVGYVAWDTDYVYLGMNSPDLAGNSTFVFWVAYLGGPNGSNSGVTYNTQQPLLPFAANWHLRWKADDSFGGALEWNGMNWITPGFGPTVGSNDVAFSGTFLEVRVAWANLGDPDLLEFHMGLVREQAFNESSWAAVPANSYVDSYDPDYAHYYEFDVLGSTLPSDHAPL